MIERVDPLKDVDGFHPVNAGLLSRESPRFVPCTPLGIRELLIDAECRDAGAHAVVLGRSQIVGKPMALLLLQKGPGGDATVTVCHTATADPAAIARQADILIVAMGRAGARSRQAGSSPARSSSTWASTNARRTALCAATSSSHDVAAVASKITPVPGGVGPMTVAMLLQEHAPGRPAGGCRAGGPFGLAWV